MIHWEAGREVFDRLLIDADWSVNNGNWMWLSASAFFAQVIWTNTCIRVVMRVCGVVPFVLPHP